MSKPQAATLTSTEEPASRELELRPTRETPRRSQLPERRPAERIKDALLRWLEEEM